MQITKTIQCPLCFGTGKIFFRPSAKAIPLESGLFTCVICEGKRKITTAETEEQFRKRIFD